MIEVWEPSLEYSPEVLEAPDPCVVTEEWTPINKYLLSEVSIRTGPPLSPGAIKPSFSI